MSARVSALELSLGSCVETFACLVDVIKGVKLFDFALDDMQSPSPPMYPHLSKLASRVTSRKAFLNVHNNLRREMTHDLLMARLSWVGKQFSGAMQLSCFSTVEETSTAQASPTWPAGLSEADPRIPLIVLGCCQGSQSTSTVICDPFSMALKIALSECNICQRIQ